METAGGESFNAAIPPFPLETPGLKRVMH
jgi:uncharacterized protein affecting Mg2+/Co2+ transport